MARGYGEFERTASRPRNAENHNLSVTNNRTPPNRQIRLAAWHKWCMNRATALASCNFSRENKLELFGNPWRGRSIRARHGDHRVAKGRALRRCPPRPLGPFPTSILIKTTTKQFLPHEFPDVLRPGGRFHVGQPVGGATATERALGPGSGRARPGFGRRAILATPRGLQSQFEHKHPE